MLYKVNVPKIYRSCRWNGMKVEILSFDGNYAITKSTKGKVLRFNKKWLMPIGDK